MVPLVKPSSFISGMCVFMKEGRFSKYHVVFMKWKIYDLHATAFALCSRRIAAPKDLFDSCCKMRFNLLMRGLWKTVKAEIINGRWARLTKHLVEDHGD